ncbi:MAG: hypothetical protein MUF35_00900 [Candidatus Nanopelagicales bacterium]|jgi:hypothetical protein|nr:hypothetical protein [Candidatus Nanopelagicales bacterium]
MDVDDYGVCMVQCRLGRPAPVRSGYWHVPFATREAGATIAQYTLEARHVPFTDHFEFLFIPDGESGDTHYIVNRRSGLCLRLASADKGAPLVQETYQPERDRDHRFVLEPAGADGTSVRFVSCLNGNLLVVDQAKPDNQLRILAYPEAAIPVERQHHLFDLLPVDATVPMPPADETLPPDELRSVPHLSSLDQELPKSVPTRGRARVLDRAHLPFFAVNDPVLPPYRQVTLSPYYTVAHWLRWDRVRDRLLDGVTQRVTTEVSTVGMTQVDAYSVRTTFHWSVEASVEAGYKGVAWSGSARVSTQLGGEVEKTRQHSGEERVDRSVTEEITYPALGRPYRVVRWVPVDVYELLATDGRVVTTWSVTREQEEATDVFTGT